MSSRHLTFVQITGKTIKELREFSKLNNIDLRKLTLKKDIANKVYEWYKEDVYQKIINSSSITEAIKEITKDFNYIDNLSNSFDLLFDHKNLALIIKTFLSQNFKTDYGKITIEDICQTVRFFIQYAEHQSSIKKQLLFCIVYKFQLENMKLIFESKNYRETVLNKIKEFKTDKKVSTFHNIDWDVKINKFIENHKSEITHVLNKNNLPIDVQKHVLLKFLF